VQCEPLVNVTQSPLVVSAARNEYFVALTHVTPVQQHNGIFFKRDDLFRPFKSPELNGGKLRQILTVLRDCRARGVITAASIHSPQIPLVAGAAYYLGLRSVIVSGGKRCTPGLHLALDFGANIKRVSSGRHRALFAKVSDLNRALRYFVIPYGIVPPPSALRQFFMIQSEQVANLPERLDALVVTCGSGVSSVGILLGIWRFSKRVRELILVATAPRRLERITGLLESYSPEAASVLKSTKVTYIDLFNTAGFRYERKIPFSIGGIDLHPRYEAKAFRHVLETTDCAERRTLFWIIGADLERSDQPEERDSHA
jgi:1-aminocyclopropane-1-carboxylate deaminase/D-cysteine desulfhydrase-like pyridoxal-dependent ACC family enzyme